MPVLDFRGTPVGIDVPKVVRTGILPQINTGMAGKVAAGLVSRPALKGLVLAGVDREPGNCHPGGQTVLSATGPVCLADQCGR